MRGRRPIRYDPSTVDPIIRDAEERDLAAILGLYKQLAKTSDGATRPENWERMRPIFADVRAHPQRLLVMELKGRIVGTLVLFIVPNLTHEGLPWAVVENVVIDESIRGAGYGLRLMEHGEAIAREAGCYKLQLTSHSEREEIAHPFYEALGYETNARAFRKSFRA